MHNKCNGVTPVRFQREMHAERKQLICHAGSAVTPSAKSSRSFCCLGTPLAGTWLNMTWKYMKYVEVISPRSVSTLSQKRPSWSFLILATSEGRITTPSVQWKRNNMTLYDIICVWCLVTLCLQNQTVPSECIPSLQSPALLDPECLISHQQSSQLGAAAFEHGEDCYKWWQVVVQSQTAHQPHQRCHMVSPASSTVSSNCDLIWYILKY